MASREDLVRLVLKRIGTNFNPGVPAQCAEFVSSMLDIIGYSGMNYFHTDWAPNFHEFGHPVLNRKDLVAGDIVLFDRTYDDGSGETDFTHIGIYIGDGYMVHRPTAARPVERAYILSGFFEDKFHEGRRFFSIDESPGTPTDGPGDNKVKACKLFWHPDGDKTKYGLIIEGKTVFTGSGEKRVGSGSFVLD